MLRPSKILLVGDFPSDKEISSGTVFTSSAGELLTQILFMAGLTRADVAMTNVFTDRPDQGNLDARGITLKAFRSSIDKTLPPEVSIPIHGTKLVARPEYSVPALLRLQQEILSVNPNVIVALGNIALNALTGLVGIGKARGSLYISSLVFGKKVIPTYHPSALFKQFDNLPIAVLDIRKAILESSSAETKLIERNLYVAQTPEDLEFVRKALIPADYLTFDIETKARQITCIGFCAEPTNIFVIPFWTKQSPDYSYWPPETEILAYKVVRDILQAGSIKIAQNGIYDIQYLASYGIKVNNYLHDTMILHHAMFPSLPKGLDFLGSLYANERAWKKLRPRKGEQKKEE